MKCKQCGKEMVLEEYYTDFLKNDEEIFMLEVFGCINCDITTIKHTYYKKEREEIE